MEFCEKCGQRPDSQTFECACNYAADAALAAVWAFNPKDEREPRASTPPAAKGERGDDPRLQAAQDALAEVMGELRQVGTILRARPEQSVIDAATEMVLAYDISEVLRTRALATGEPQPAPQDIGDMECPWCGDAILRPMKPSGGALIAEVRGRPWHPQCADEYEAALASRPSTEGDRT